MRTLIVCTARSGGNGLCRRIAEEQNVPAIFNPFDGTGRTSIPKDSSNIVVKADVSCPNDDYFKATYPINVLKRIQFFKDIISTYKFDNVILLDRRDREQQIESLAWKVEFLNVESIYDYTSETYIYESELVDFQNIKHAKNLIGESKVYLRRLGYKLGIEISYYEDLFNISSNERQRKFQVQLI